MSGTDKVFEFENFPEGEVVSEKPTPWAVRCFHCNKGELVYMTRDEYLRQLRNADNTWECPCCGQRASWNDSNYEQAMEQWEQENG